MNDSVGTKRQPTVRVLARMSLASLACGLVSGCVTLDLDDFETEGFAASSVIIPLDTFGPSTERDPIAEYYRSVMLQLHDAVLERHPERLWELCALHDKAAAPDWARAQIDRFRKTGFVLDAERFVQERSQLTLRRGPAQADAAPCVIGQRVPLRFFIDAEDVAASPGRSLVRLQTAHTRFSVDVEAVDHDCLGGRVVRRFSHVLDLPRDYQVGAAAMAIPFDLDELAPEGVRRELTVRVTWLPGSVHVGSVDVGGESMPNRRVVCSEGVFELFPRGVEAVRSAPLRTLRNALSTGETRHLDNVCLAARFLPEEDRSAGIALLMERIRLGHRIQARACMAALRDLTGAAVSLDDREGWLRWWSSGQSRR